MIKQRQLAFYSDQQSSINRDMDERLMGLIGRNQPRIGYVASEPDPGRDYYQRTREVLARQLTDYVHRGGVLIGVSAGAVVMTPNVLSAELCGDVRP